MRVCFLILLTVLSVTPLASAAEIIGAWMVSVEESALDNTKSASLVTVGKGNDKHMLGIRCSDGQAALIFGTGDYMGIAKRTEVQTLDYKLDDGRVDSLYITPVPGGSAVQLSKGGATPERFIKRLMDGKRLVVRVTPYQKAAVEMIFDLSDLKGAMAPAAKVCGVE